jgi:hypothetical protein
MCGHAETLAGALSMTKVCFLTPLKNAELRSISRMNPAGATAANLLSRDEARRIAANIAKLPELVKRPQSLSLAHQG